MIIEIDGKKYNLKNVPPEVLNLLKSIKFVEAEISRMENELKIYLAAKSFYVSRLKHLLENFENTVDEKLSYD